MCKRNKACIYMFIVVMVLQIIIPALSVILETSYTLTSEAADDTIATWDIGKTNYEVKAKLTKKGVLKLTTEKNEGCIKDGGISWIYNDTDYKNKIKKVIIGDKITYIGRYAFDQCNNLKSVNKGNNVVELGEGAFARCSNLQFMSIKARIIGAVAFYDCKKLTVEIPYNVERIDSTAFYGVNKVQGTKATNHKLVLGNKLEVIGESAFKDVTNLESVIVISEEFEGNTSRNLFPKETQVYCKKNSKVWTYRSDKKAYFTKIELTSTPKENYKKGERLQLKNETLKISFSDGESQKLNFNQNLMWSNPTNNTRLNYPGKKTVKICIGAQEDSSVKATFDIFVSEKVESIDVTVNKKEYNVLDYIKSKDITVKANFKNGYRILDPDEYSINPRVFSSSGDKDIVVKYNADKNIKKSYKVKVKNFTTEITKFPQQSYKKGDALNLDGLECKLQYEDGSFTNWYESKDIKCYLSGKEIKQGDKLNETGTHKITVKTNDDRNIKLGTFNIDVASTQGEIDYIEILGKPGKNYKVDYIVGEKLLNDFKIRVYYKDKSYIDTNNYKTVPVKGKKLENAETNKKIEVIYNNKYITHYNINVAQKQVTKIEPTGNYTMLYTVGDTLNLEGLKLKVSYNNGSSDIIDRTNFETNPPDRNTVLNEKGYKRINILYGGKQTYIYIAVKERTLIRIASTNLGKSDYIEGENFEAGELFHVVAVYDNNSMEEVFNYTVVDGDNLKLGQKTVTISYEENGKTVTTTTPITVTPKQLEKIEITREPNKTTYIQGQNFDSTGMQVTATYNSGKTAIINNYSVPNGQNLTVGMTSVKIVYTENGVSKEVEQPITVTLKQPINIRVKENVKKVYIVGEKVDKTNMCVEIEYDDGSIEQVTNYEVDTETSLSRADKTRTITYKEGDITLEKEIDVPVLPAEIQEISIKQYPDDVNYVVGQKFFSNGLILLVKYADETEEEITEDFTLDLPDGSVLTKVETKTVKVNYMGQEVKFDINVKENDDIQALTIMDGSIETNYEIGEKLDLRGLVLISEGSNNDIKVIWGNYECEPAEGTELNTKGQQTITIKYAGKSAVLNINVGEHQVEEIEIENLPKTKYVVGQALDLTGLKLKVMYNNGTEEIVETGYTSSIEDGTIFNNVENKTIEISYKEKTTSFDIDVVKKQVEKLKGISAPTKTKYKVGEALDLSGVKFKAIYNDGEEKEIETGYTSSIPNGTILDTIGYNPIILEYEGKTITALVFVGEIAIESISINTEPDKVVYQVGEQLDLTGLSIKAKYENGEEDIIKSGFETTPEDGKELNIKGQKEVTVKLGEKTATFNVDVQGKKDAPTLTEIKIAKAPDKTKYKVGENFDKTGMVVKAIYSDGNSKEVTDYICMPEEQLEKETTEITIIYTEDTITKYAKQKIEVVEDGGGDNQGDNNNNNDNNNNDNDNSENNNNGNNSNNNNNNNNSNNGNNNNSNNNNNTNDGKNEDKVDGKIPQTGENSIMLIAGAILTVISVIIYIKIKKFEI